MGNLTAVPEAVKLEVTDCPLCGPAPTVRVVSGFDRLHDLPGEFTVVECSRCGLLRTNPRPTPETIGFYYPPNYGPYLGTVVASQAEGGLKAKLVNLGKQLLQTKSTVIPAMAPGRLLEIGCASGSYLHAMAARGWQVEGIEFSPEAAASARKLGYRVDAGAVETIERDDAEFDLITGWMVVEHLHQPLAVLRKLRRWVKPQGKLAISVPNAGSLERRVFGTRWYALHLPAHLYHYDPASIRKLMAAAGWRVTKIHHHRSLANLVASAGYLLRDKGHKRLGQTLIDFPEKSGRLGALLLFPFAWIAALFGQTGRMTVWAEPI
jgi:2-polyprenyl-3-methyl-5-hydroxy-6-metoxy-1,4-benzoquinol methylase